jgi:hypothetical protein
MNDDESVSAEPSTPEEDWLEQFEKLPSTLPNCGVDLRSFASEADAQAVGEITNAYLQMLGKTLNLKRLLRVIVAFDYRETLAGIDRGTSVAKPLTATNDELAVGIAMTPTVIHEGEARSVIVLNAGYMIRLTHNDSAETEALRADIVYTLAHECGHVHDLNVRATNLPGTILKAVHRSFRDDVLFPIAYGCWDEYIACFLSAHFGIDSTLRGYEETFVASLERAKDRADAAIRQYRMHADIKRVVQEVSEEYRRLMVYAAYLIGHVEGLEGNLDEMAPKAVDAMERHNYFKPFFEEIRSTLMAMHDICGEWKGLEAYDPLKEIAYRLLKVGGLDIQDRPDGLGRVDIPFSPATIPSLSEQMAFQAAKNQE